MVSEKRPKMSESRLILPVDAGHEEGAFQGCDPFLEQFPAYGFLVMDRQRPEAPRHLLQVRPVHGGLRLEVRSHLLQGAPGRVHGREVAVVSDQAGRAAAETFPTPVRGAAYAGPDHTPLFDTRPKR